jgi:DNA-binding response OmpR family regulator
MPGRAVVGLVCVPEEIQGDLADALERRGHLVKQADEAWEVRSLLSATGIDLVLIGPRPPEGSAMDLMREYATGPAPSFVLMTGTGDLVEKVLALELGAADVVDRSANARELAARITGILTRLGRATGDLVVLENATVDMRAALVMHRSGTEDQLSPGQIALLRLFVGNPHKVLTREDIIAAAPAESVDAFDRSIDSRIVRLRRKLDTESIVTIRGTGYRYDPPTDAGS